jgi:hypothetical protein
MSRSPTRRDVVTVARGMVAALCEPRERLLNSELARLLLQVGGVVVVTVAIGLLVSFTTDADEPRVKDDRPDRIFP